MQDIHLIEKLAHFDRERIPERVVHAKGAGAYGYFEVTARRDPLHPGQVPLRRSASAPRSSPASPRWAARRAPPTPTATLAGSRSSSTPRRATTTWWATTRPVFFIRDPLKFPDFIHTQKRHPATNLKDADMFWDFLSLTPESIHQVTILFSDRGTPTTFRHMNGYSSHTFKWYNAEGDYVLGEVPLQDRPGHPEPHPRGGRRSSRRSDPDHATRDLFEAIARGDYPSWTPGDADHDPPSRPRTYRFDLFDITKVWPHGDFPPIKIGRLVLNRNPENYFAEVEQAAFSPGNLVPGIAPSPDKMLQGRLFSYHDTHRHRLGPNYHLMPVNSPKAAPESSYQRDGFMRLDANGGGGPNY